MLLLLLLLCSRDPTVLFCCVVQSQKDLEAIGENFSKSEAGGSDRDPHGLPVNGKGSPCTATVPHDLPLSGHAAKSQSSDRSPQKICENLGKKFSSAFPSAPYPYWWPSPPVPCSRVARHLERGRPHRRRHRAVERPQPVFSSCV